MVLRVEVLHPGDERGNGLLRWVIYRLPFGRTGSAFELVTDVEPRRGHAYTMTGREPGNEQTGRVRLEPTPRGCRLHFGERHHLGRFPGRLFEGPICRFINRQNERSMRALSGWLDRHPGYRPDLAGASGWTGTSARPGPPAPERVPPGGGRA